MMEQILNVAKAAAVQATADRADVRHGILKSYDADNFAGKVELQPDGTMTGWMPIKSLYVGNGWGLFCAPSLGDHVEVDFQEGDKQSGSIGLRFWNDQARPLGVPEGEFWLVHKTLGSFKMTTDGKITLTDHHGSIVQLDNAGNINLTATTVAITGDVTVTGKITAQGDVIGNGTRLHTHTHSGVQAGSGTSGAPT